MEWLSTAQVSLKMTNSLPQHKSLWQTRATSCLIFLRSVSAKKLGSLSSKLQSRMWLLSWSWVADLNDRPCQANNDTPIQMNYIHWNQRLTKPTTESCNWMTAWINLAYNLHIGPMHYMVWYTPSEIPYTMLILNDHIAQSYNVRMNINTNSLQKSMAIYCCQ